jgi:hypothetical protein
MAYMMGMGNCCICGSIFQFNPERVPSVLGAYDETGFHLDPAGKRHAICLSCMNRGNELRRRNGKQPFAIPAGAYESEEI